MTTPAGGRGAPLQPLLPSDPPKIGDFWLDGRLTAAASGVAYVAHDDAGTTTLLVLLSEGATEDAAARDRFAGQVNKMHIDTVVARGGQGQDEGRLGHRFRSEDDDPVGPADQPLAPWVALAYDGSPAASAEADRLLAEVDLSRLPSQGAVSGPAYRLPWIERTQPGLSRLWPLPWPGRYDRAGRLSVLASWLLMLLIAMLAILLAILMFSQAPESSPPPPLPPTGSPPPSGSPPPESGSPPPSGSPSPESGSPSPQSGSPSPQSGSPSPSGSESGSGSPSPSGSESGSASPSPSGSQSGGSSPSPSPSSSGSGGPSGSPTAGAPSTYSKL